MIIFKKNALTKTFCEKFLSKTTAFLCLLASNAICAIPEAMPKLSDKVVPPQKLTLKCIGESKNLPTLDACRAQFEGSREEAEEYNHRISRFCKSLTKFDAQLREKANAKKISWEDYEDLKVNIVAELEECDPASGDYYFPYRSHIREYKHAQMLIKERRYSIVNNLAI